MNIFNDKDWVGFCAYRRFWLNEKESSNTDLPFKRKILREVPETWNNYDVILANEISMDNIKLIKIIKYGKLALLNNPRSFFKKGRNIRFHFDMFHGIGVLDKAIDLLDSKDREDFRKYVDTQVMFNPYNMFICKNKSILFIYYSAVFPWLEKCEKIFGFDLGNSYGKKRIYVFLTKRFLSYWFNKYANPISWPIYFKDIN